MNVTFLIGNGFDLNIGIKTSYRDFYKYYTEQSSEDELINNLKIDIEKDISQWSDLEKRLGEYTENLNNIREYEVIVNDIRKNLQTFLANQSAKINFNQLSANRLKQDLIFPENHLLPDYLKEITKFKDGSSIIEVSIITFNYTEILEKIISVSNFINERILIENTRYIFKPIQHIHGYINSRMVLGVDNENQILNPKLNHGINNLKYIVKPYINDTYRSSHHTECMNIIKNSHLIILFGLSYGDTDNTWWKIILDRLIENPKCKLIIYHYEPTFVDIENNGPGRETREDEIKTDFMSKIGLDKTTMLNIEKRIIVGINSKIFNIPFENIP